MTGIAPVSASAVERGMDEVSAARVTALPVTLPTTAWNADLIPETWLPVLAWALSVDLWNPDWPPKRQRAAIKDAYAQHRLKGTPAGWKLVLDRIGALYDIVERPGGEVFKAKISIYNLADITLPSEAHLQQLLQRTKRASVHLTVEARSGVSLALALAAGAGGAAFNPAVAHLEINESP